MINYPVTFFRNFKYDVPHNYAIEQKKILALLPLVTLYRPVRKPLSLGMSGLRLITCTKQMAEELREGHKWEGLFQFFHVTLATSSVGLFFFNPIFSFCASSVSDLLFNAREFIEYRSSLSDRLEALGSIALDLLFLASFCYGSIEITVACMLFQAGFNLCLSARDLKKGDRFEGLCKAIYGSALAYQALPQVKLLHWKWSVHPPLTAELKQDAKGFVYLDIPDEVLFSLVELFRDQHIELPPYFGNGKVGAHVTAIPIGELNGRRLNVEDIGKKISFRIVSMDSVEPSGSKTVYILTLSCSELESVRIRYGLSPKINQHDFHLTFGIQRKEGKEF